MARDKIEIEVLVRDEVSRQLNHIKKGTDNFKSKVSKNFVDLAAKVYLFQKAVMALNKVISQFVNASSKVQQLQVRLKVLFGSVEEGNKLFEEMAILAGEVPKTYDEIMESATNLAAVVRGGSEEVANLMPVIIDLSAATGISVRDVTSQMIRMYSAGAASADMFRERGVLAMLGFQAGVSYTAEETMKQVNAAWESSTSKFRGASEELAETWEGQMSMMADAWFKFSANLGDFITTNETILTGIEAITYAIGFWADELERLASAQTEGKSALLEDLNAQLELTNKLIDKNMTLQAQGWSGRDIEENINNLLIQKQRLILAIIDAREKEGLIHITVAKEEEKTLKKQIKTREEANKAIVEGAFETLEKIAEVSKAGATALKVIRTAEAIINTHAAVNQALASFPPPQSWIMASINLAKGMAEVAAIQATAFAEGGIVTRPTIGLVGEAGPEAIIPLDKAGGFGDINITIENANMSSPDDVADLAVELGFEMERQLRYGGGI